MKVVKNADGEWMFDAGPHLVAMSCHHKKTGACGGCYARVVRAIQDMAEREPRAAEVLKAMKAEAPR